MRQRGGNWRATSLLTVSTLAIAPLACSASPGATAIDGSSLGDGAGLRDAAADRAPRADARDAARGDATTPDAGRDGGHDATLVDASHMAPDARDAAAVPDAADAGRDVASRDATVDVGVGDGAPPDVHDAARDVEDAGEDAGHDAGPPPPSLLSLTVSPLQLFPAFSPSIHDYYVRCAAGANPLDVDVTAASGETTTISQPVASGPAHHQARSFSLLENQAVVVNAVQGTATTPYWIRCIPHDFPVLAPTVYADAGTAPPGYYFIGNVFKATGVPGEGEGGYAAVLDLQGTPVWYGKTLNNAGAKGTDLIAPNVIAYIPIAGYTLGTFEGSFELHSLNPVGVTYVTSVGEPVDTHELRKVPDGSGDYLVFTDKIELGVDLTSLQTDGGYPYTANEDLLNCIIQEVSPTGQKVWEWKATDHFDLTESVEQDHQRARYVAGTPGEPEMDGGVILAFDVFHCNAIDFDPSGNLLVSSRNMDAVFLIKRDPGKADDGKVLWKMGGWHTDRNKDHAKPIAVVGDALQGFHRQHHARFAYDGTVTLFDDHGNGPDTAVRGPARALQLSYDVNAGTASILWQFANPFGTNSIAMGSVSVLADGSHVIGWGDPAMGDTLALTELDATGTKVLFELRLPDSPESSYRALKYPPSMIDLDAMRAAIGPWSSGDGIPDAGSDAARDAATD